MAREIIGLGGRPKTRMAFVFDFSANGFPLQRNDVDGVPQDWIPQSLADLPEEVQDLLDATQRAGLLAGTHYVDLVSWEVNQTGIIADARRRYDKARARRLQALRDANWQFGTAVDR